MKKTILKVLKKMLATLGVLSIVMLLIGFLFLNFSPEFGGTATKEQERIYARSEHYSNGRFMNLGGVKMEMGGRAMLKSIGEMLNSDPNSRPKNDLKVEKLDAADLADPPSGTRLIWFGHSAFLLQINNRNILIDPMFGDVPAPNPLLGARRFSSELPIAIEQLPQIDAVLISHDHYDHLDYGSIQQLKDKVGKFYTPLGVGVHLTEWGIDGERIVELDWWQEADVGSLIFRCTPAQHFSGRALTDREKTFWCSWIIKSETENIFFSGDSGYAPHFKEIGERYGPFDFAMMECGQYNELWPTVHMFPEETAQAAADMGAKLMMPIHWGAFKLAMHSWTDPVERVTRKAKELNVELITPRIGEPIVLENISDLGSNWWKDSTMD